MTSSLYAQIGVNGLNLSALYILIALGFTLIFGIVKVINFAHGEFVMAGGFFAFYLDRVGVHGVWAVLGAAVATALLTIPLEKFVFRPLYQKEESSMIVSLGLSVVMIYTAVILFGASQRSIPPQYQGVIQFEGVSLAKDRLIALPVCVVTLGLFYLWIKHSKIGLAMRIVAQDQEAAQIQGVSPLVTFRIAFAVSGAMAGIAGALLAQMYSLSPFIGATPLIKAFIVVVIGGLGSIAGAAVGGLILGMSESVLTTLYGASIAQFASFGGIMLLLIVRPRGLFGTPSR